MGLRKTPSTKTPKLSDDNPQCPGFCIGTPNAQFAHVGSGKWEIGNAEMKVETMSKSGVFNNAL